MQLEGGLGRKERLEGLGSCNVVFDVAGLARM